MNQIAFHHGDNRDVLRRLIAQGVRVHSVVTDPPYHLESVVKRFGKTGSAPAKPGTDGLFTRQSKGFMGKAWDGADEDGSRIAFDPEFWALIYEILLPGGYVLAFSSPRTGHWQACAMETAGFVMHPFLGWVYGQGFPKAHSAARAIDQALGVKGQKEAVGAPVRRLRPGADQNNEGTWEKLEDRVYQPGAYIPASDEAAMWDGWAYGGQALKPAMEPIYVGQKPFSERNGALNILRHGVGAINIDDCRLAAAGAAQGRWPANLLHDGSDDVVALFPAQAGAAAPVRGTEPSMTGDPNTVCYGQFNRVPGAFHADSGSAARFFNAFPDDDDLWVTELTGQPIFYHGKATKADRDGSRHPTVKPTSLMQWLCRLVTPPGGTVLDPFAGSGSTGVAATREDFAAILIEREFEYAADIRRRFGIRAPLPFDVLELLGGESVADLIG